MSENYAHEQRTMDLISVLAALKESEYDPILQIDNLDAIYYEGAPNDKDGNPIPYRHSYSAISAQIYHWCRENSTYDSELFTVLIDKIGMILERIGSSHRLVKPLTKLQDHISLESVRLAQLEAVFVQLQAAQQSQEQLNDLLKRSAEVQQALSEYEIKAEKLQEDIDKKNESLEELEKNVVDVHTQSISVLSIFAGMAFIFTGGFTMLSGVFTALQNIDKHTALLLASVLVFICTALIDAVWMLIRSARKYVKDNNPIPKSFFCFTVFMCAIAIGLFVLYIFDPWGFESCLQGCLKK